MSGEEITTHRWGDAPELYGPRHDYREALLVRRLRAERAGPRLLNAGCGAGSLTLKLVEAGFEVTSVDASEAFCEWVGAALARRGLAERHPVVRRELGVGALDLPAAAFDTVVCAEVLEHLDDDRAALSELAAVLRPGGLLLVSVPANPFRYDWTDRWAGHRRRYTVDELAGKLADAGFEAVDVGGWGFPLTGFFHRRIYRPLLRRRLARPASARAAGGGLGGGPPRLAARAVRAALELDTLFLGRHPGYHGLIAVARRAQPRR